MKKPKTIIITVKEFIAERDLIDLKKVSDVTYIEKEKTTQEEINNLVKGFDYLMLNYDVIMKLDPIFYQLSNVKKLKGISTDITGMDWASPSAANKAGILLMNTSNYCTDSVAEAILCEVLLHAKKRHAAYQDIVKGNKPEARKGINLKNRTAGIIGLGNIGIRTAELLQGIGMRTIGWNRTNKKVENLTQLSSIQEVFSKSDVVCLCLKTVKDGSQKTAGIIDKKILSSSKKGLILVNLAGNELVDHTALLEELKLEKIAGYSVTLEDISKRNAIAKLDCVSLPPANAWFTDESLNELRRVWVQNIVCAIQGKPQNIIKE